MKQSYAEKLLDPRWQKRRLEILSKTDFTCQMCHDGENTLHVHHLLYRKGTDPWDYEDHELMPLCRTCHQDAEDARDELLSILGQFPPELPIRGLVGALCTILMRDPWEIWHWFIAAEHPDLLAEALRRRAKKLGVVKASEEVCDVR